LVEADPTIVAHLVEMLQPADDELALLPGSVERGSGVRGHDRDNDQ
jgi:hypothetical protein